LRHDIIDIMPPLRYVNAMASLLIRNLDDKTKTLLRVRAAEKGRSMEAEARDILNRELYEPEKQKKPARQKNLAEIAREIFGEHGVDLEIPPRVPGREPPDFSE
jgi:antitoxin FitA